MKEIIKLVIFAVELVTNFRFFRLKVKLKGIVIK